jgi:AcrR family transcriptional regulator
MEPTTSQSSDCLAMMPKELPSDTAPTASRAGRGTSPDGTTDRLLDTAEALFASRGYAAVSMRAIAAGAAVNVAAAHYHFGSKAGLFEAVFSRRIVPINRARVARLEHWQNRGPLHARAIADSFVAPLLTCRDLFDTSCDPETVMMLLGRTTVEFSEHPTLMAYHSEMTSRFLSAIRDLDRGVETRVPDVSANDRALVRFNAMVAVVSHHALGQRGSIGPRASIGSSVPEAAAALLVSFIGAGLAANELP